MQLASHGHKSERGDMKGNINWHKITDDIESEKMRDVGPDRMGRART